MKVPLTLAEEERHGNDVDFSAMTAEFDPKEVFKVQSSQDLTPFLDIPAGEMIYHRHNGRPTAERTASAKTWSRGSARGYFCFTCGINYHAKESGVTILEDRYLFPKDSVRQPEVDPTTNAPFPYISDPADSNAVDWGAFLQKKWTIIDAPMGLGKTRELERLMAHVNRPSTLRPKVLVVTFRVSLAFELARRLGIQCYRPKESNEIRQKELDGAIRRDRYDQLVICINSLGKLGSDHWDIIVFDECGLIRLHCLASITTSHLHLWWETFVRLMQNASNVILAQEFVSERDVEFYMDLAHGNPYDFSAISSLRFDKPTKYHDILHTFNFYAAVSRMLKSYHDAFD